MLRCFPCNVSMSRTYFCLNLAFQVEYEAPPKVHEMGPDGGVPRAIYMLIH